MDTDWTNTYRGYHDLAVQQGKEVAEIVTVCNRDEPSTLLLQAVNEIAAELVLHRLTFAAIRVGIERGQWHGSQE